MNFCPNCGSKLDGKVRFCPNCGASVAGQSGSSFGSAGAGAGSGQQMSIETDYSRYRGYEDYASGTRSAGSQYTNAGDGAYSGAYSSGAYSNGNAQGAGAYGNAGAQRTRAYTAGTSAGISRRNIALCVIFSLLTFGIYGLFWMAKENDDINLLSGEVNATGGGMVVLLSIVSVCLIQDTINRSVGRI